MPLALRTESAAATRHPFPPSLSPICICAALGGFGGPFLPYFQSNQLVAALVQLGKEQKTGKCNALPLASWFDPLLLRQKWLKMKAAIWIKLEGMGRNGCGEGGLLEGRKAASKQRRRKCKRRLAKEGRVERPLGQPTPMRRWTPSRGCRCQFHILLLWV